MCLRVLTLTVLPASAQPAVDGAAEWLAAVTAIAADRWTRARAWLTGALPLPSMAFAQDLTRAPRMRYRRLQQSAK